MAITFVGSDSTLTGANTNSLTLSGWTGGITSGDFAIAYGRSDEGGAVAVLDITDAGWTLLDNQNPTTGRDRVEYVWWRVLDGTETSVTMSTTVSQEHSFSVHAFRGVDSISPIDTWAFDSNQNDVAPPSPAVTTQTDSAAIVVLHGATHDDITTAGAPAGYTLGEAIIGSAVDHRGQVAAYLLDAGTLGTVDPGSWTHAFTSAATAEWSCYTIALRPVQLVGITSWPSSASNSQAGVVLGGFGFEASQGSGKVELWSDQAGGTKLIQTVSAWSDVSITIDLAAGVLGDSFLYLVVTNDSGDASAGAPISVGFPPYDPRTSVGFDHFWKLDGDYVDSGQQSNRDGIVLGEPPVFDLVDPVRSAAQTSRFDDPGSRVEIADSSFTNVSIKHAARVICGWVKLGSFQELPACIWEEGGGVNNFYFIAGFGNVLLANVADSSEGFKIQAVSDRILLPDRWYHIAMVFSGTAFDNEFVLWVDGVKQLVTNGNPVGTDTMSTHSGDFGFGNPDSNLDTGGTDIAYDSCTTMWLSNWGTASNTGGGAPVLGSVIRTRLFEDGAPQEHSIGSDTAASMQAAISSFDSQTHSVLHGMTYQVSEPTGGGDLTLQIADQVFPGEISCHLRWLGTGTLTVINLGSSNASIASTPSGGTVVFSTPPKLTLTNLTDPTEVRVYRAGTTIEIGGTEDVTTGTFTLSIDEIANPTVDIAIVSLGYQNIQLLGQDMTGGDVSLPITQRVDRQYLNP